MRGSPVTYFDYSGGRNTRDAPYLLTERQCRDQLNVHTSLSGDIEKRTGFVEVGSVSAAPVSGTGVHTLFPANASTKSLLGAATISTKDKIFKMTTAGTATVLKEGLTANTRWWFAQADVNAGEGPIFGLNGVDIPQRWNGSAASTSDWVATTGTVPKKAKFLTYFSSRLWALEGSRLWYSGITGSTPDPMSWPAENYVDLDPNDGQEGTGIGIVGSYLVVTKARKVYVVYDPITGANRQISHEIGCIAPRSIVQTPVGLLFLSEDQGVCVTNGETVKPISEEVDPDLREVASSPSTAALAAGILDGDRYQLSISLGGTRNDHTLEYDLQNKSWWLHDCASNQFALLDPGGTPQLYSADPSSPRVDKAFVEGTFTDHGSAYAGGSFWTSPWRAWGVGGASTDPHITKRINEIRIDGVGAWDAYVATNFDEDFELMEGETWEAANVSGTFEEEAQEGSFEEEQSGSFEDSVNATVTLHYPTPALGRSFSMRYVNNDTSNFRIYSEAIALTARSN